MRTLMAIVIATMLIGCSDRPDLTKEQLDALQVIGEMTQPDPVRDARYDYRTRMVEWMQATPDWHKHDDINFETFEENLHAEHERRKTIYGAEKAADWYVEETRKPILHLLKEWAKPERKK